MRERARDKSRLEDIVKYSNHVTEIVKGASYEDFASDIRIYYSVMKNVEVVGEAAFMLTKAFKAEHTDTPWKMVESMRHILVHDYANVNPETLYDTACNDIVVLREQAKRYLAETDWEKWTAEEDLFNDMEDLFDKRLVGMARNMKTKGYSTEEIAEITGLSDIEIMEL